ncbi:unnamed protein product [Sympodiomycopsis kandeliae]
MQPGIQFTIDGLMVWRGVPSNWNSSAQTRGNQLNKTRCYPDRMAATLSSALPAPKYTPTVEDDFEDSRRIGPSSSSSSSAVTITSRPARGNRRAWKPKMQEDFGDGGAYPECHVAQYPLEMGRKRSGASGGSLALQVDAQGNVRYDAIVQQGRREGQRVQSRHQDLVPLSKQVSSSSSLLPDRPDAKEVAECAARTKAALEKITNGKIATAAPTHVENTQGNSSYIRYTPGQQGSTNGQQRIIKMTETVEDPLEPPRWKFKKVPKGPPSPPPPVLRSPPRKITAEEAKEWTVPPSISNWKNNKGYTIPLDKRLAADGRGLQDIHVNDGFASFSEALVLAERHAREEVRQRSLMQQKLAAKEKASREEHLRQLAQRAREERSGLGSASSVASSVVDGGYEEEERVDPRRANRPKASDWDRRSRSRSGSEEDDRVDRAGETVQWQRGRRDSRDSRDSRSRSISRTPPSPRRRRSYSRSRSQSYSQSSSGSDSEAEARERDKLRAERRRERERDLRMSNMGVEQRSKHLARESNRDISEKVALGLAKPTSKGGEIDSRLFNQEKLSSTFGDEDSYNVYEKPLLQGSSAAQAIYSRPTNTSSEGYGGGGTAEGVSEEISRNDRFNMGVGTSKHFSGAELHQDGSTGPVQFEKDTVVNDPFAIDQFLNEAQRQQQSKGTKREGLHLKDDGGGDEKRRKRDE